MIQRGKKRLKYPTNRVNSHFETLEPRRLLAGDLVINEFMADNASTLRDASGQYEDWIEIHNTGQDAIDLDGWHLTDDPTELDKWEFPSQILPAGAYLTVFASGRDLVAPDAELHTNFKLTSDGEYLALTQDNPSAMDPDAIDIATEFAPAYPAQLEDISYGNDLYFENPTPGAANSTGVEGFLINDVTFSHEHGFYDDAFQLTIESATTGTTIRYTTDGREPTATRGTVYSGPITIDETTVLRARSFKDGLDPSNVSTASYLMVDDILRQSRTGSAPQGWPSSRNINGQEMNYGMDPDIVNSNRWGPQLEAALKQVPSFSIVMDINDLLSSSRGIYTHARSHGKSWEREISVEQIDPSGEQKGFTEKAGLRIRGGFSRSGSNPKHSFRLFFRDEYGASKLNYPLFGDEGASEFDGIDLRTTQNYSWAFQGDGRNAFVRDVFSRDLQRDMGHHYTRSRYHHLYINGQYWGLYQTQERAEASYAASYMGGEPEDYDVIKSTGSSGGYVNEATDGNTRAYRRLANYFYQSGGLSDSKMDDYWKAQGLNADGTRNPNEERLLDVENLIDYMLLTYFTGDRDGPGSKFTRPGVNNYFAIFNRENPDGFKFFEHDSEHSLDTGENDMVNPLTTGGAGFNRFNPHWMHEQLARTNSIYRRQFADRVYEQIFNDGLLAPENAKRLIDTRASEFDMAIIAESARWGDAKRGTPYTKSNWENAVDSAKSFLDTRANVLLGQLRSQSWYPETNAPLFAVNGALQHGGTIGTNDEVSFIATASTSYSTILPKGSTWKYLDNGSNQGTAWRNPGFNDASWESGRAELGYGDTQRTEVGFGGNSNDKHITTYFRKEFDVADKGAYESLQLRLQRDDGAVVYLNGEEVVRSNMPGGVIRHTTTSSGVVGGGDETTFFEFDIDLSKLNTGTNTLAVEIHQTSGTSSDISFDLDLRGGTFNPAGGAVYYTLDGTDPLLPNGDISPSATLYDGNPFTLDRTVKMGSRLFDNNEWSPLATTDFLVDRPAAAGDLVISEINYNPHRPIDRLGELGVDKDNFEFVELLNTSGTRIDLTGVRFATVEDDAGASQGIEFTFGTQTLEAGQRIVIAKDRSAFASRYGTEVQLADGSGESADDGTFGGNLRNSGEQLTLLAADGSTIQQFNYDDSGSWPRRADGGASSLEVIDPQGDFASSRNWRNSSEFGGTPGTPGTGPIRDVVINEILTHTDLPQIDAVEIHNTTNSPVNVAGWYISDGSDNYFRSTISIISPPLAAGEYLTLNETQLGFGFRGQTSDDVWLLEAKITGEPIRFVDHVEFDATDNGVTLGRWPNAQGNLFPMTSPTLGDSNSGPAVSPVVISEVQYNPIATGDLTSNELEFVELWNHTGTPIDIGHWRLDEGVDFNLPAGTTLNANERILIVPFDPTDSATAAEFRTAYGIGAGAEMLGPFEGVLDNGGEKVELKKPEDLAALGVGYVLTDRVDYDDDAPWPGTADGNGASLNRTVGTSYGDFSSSWIAVAPTPGSAPNTDDIPGDFNRDQLVNLTDIDLLCGGVRGAAGEFDLDNNGTVDTDDLLVLVETIIGTGVGDVDLDGVFNSTDLIKIFQANEYEDAIDGNSTWSEGDWDCDGDFSTSDLILAFQRDSYTAAATPKTSPRSAAIDRVGVAANTQAQQDTDDSVGTDSSNRSMISLTLTNETDSNEPVDLELQATDRVFEDFNASDEESDDDSAFVV